MPKYSYSAIDVNGKSIVGTLEAATQSQLIQRTKEKGLYLLSFVDQAEAKSREVDLKSNKVKIKQLAVFCRQFATLINSGITAVKSLDILYVQTEDKGLKACLGRVYEGVQKGESLSEAFRRQGNAFPELFYNMIMAGEGSGNLDSVLIRLADHFERENKLNNKIKGAMIYPIVLAVLTIIVVIGMVVFILPTFTDLITSSGGEIPLPTRLMMGLSNFIIGYWWLLIALITLAVISWRAYTRSEKGKLWWDTKKLVFPIVGKSMRMIYTARFARTMSTMLSSGIQMLPAIDMTSRVVNNQYIHDRLVNMIEDIRKGVSLSLTLKRIEQFPPMLHNMVLVGEESGMLDDILNKTAAFFDEESETAIQKLVGLIEPLMIIIMAFVIGFIVISIYLPMIGMYNAVG